MAFLFEYVKLLKTEDVADLVNTTYLIGCCERYALFIALVNIPWLKNLVETSEQGSVSAQIPIYPFLEKRSMTGVIYPTIFSFFFRRLF